MLDCSVRFFFPFFFFFCMPFTTSLFSSHFVRRASLQFFEKQFSR